MEIAPLLLDEVAKQALDPPVGQRLLVPERSPAYKALAEAGLIVQDYQVHLTSDLDLMPANSDVGSNACRLIGSFLAVPILGGIGYMAVFKQFSVQEGHVRCGKRSDGSYLFFGAGVHRYKDPFLSVDEKDTPLIEKVIQHGNRTILTVPQGFVGLAFDKGLPVLLPPGMHQWKSDTLRLSELIDLSAAVIYIGPFTLLTVDEGYAAVTQDNGKQRVLPGGQTHMLTHRNWKFESFISLKIHTDDLGPVQTTTADNVVLNTTATVNWRVEDPASAALMAADTMPGKGISDAIGTLSKDVLKQALASLATAIATVRYSDEHHVAASDKVIGVSKPSTEDPSWDEGLCVHDKDGLARIFSANQMSLAVRHANEICSQYGVRVVNINIISAFPKDLNLQQSLSAGAVASATAQQSEIAARGNAKAKFIAANAEAQAMRINAQAVADAEKLKAQGKKDAAALLESSAVAVDLAKIERASELIGDKTSFFFGAGPQAIPALLSNPNLAH